MGWAPTLRTLLLSRIFFYSCDVRTSFPSSTPSHQLHRKTRWIITLPFWTLLLHNSHKTTSNNCNDYSLPLKLLASCYVAAAAACACSQSCVLSRQASSEHRRAVSCCLRSVPLLSGLPASPARIHIMIAHLIKQSNGVLVQSKVNTKLLNLYSTLL